MKKIIPIIVIIMSSTAVLSAQDFRYDAGIAGGISCYMGDANQVSPWHRPGAAISGVFRFLLNYRWAVKTDISAMQFSGDTRDFDNRFPNGSDYSFESWQYRLGGQIEFNFFNYGMGYSGNETAFSIFVGGGGSRIFDCRRRLCEFRCFFGSRG